MGYLLETNVLIRLARKNGPQRHEALVALRLLRSRNEDLYYTSQVLAEFWNVCTLPSSARGGLGLSIQETDRKSRIVEKYFTFLSDSARNSCRVETSNRCSFGRGCSSTRRKNRRLGPSSQNRGMCLRLMRSTSSVFPGSLLWHRIKSPDFAFASNPE